MAVKTGEVKGVQQLFTALVSFLTSNTYMGNSAWRLMEANCVDLDRTPNVHGDEASSRGTLTDDTNQVVVRGKGDGSDEIYVGIMIRKHGDSQENLCFNGYAGFDEHLAWWEQPGTILAKPTDPLPCMPFSKDIRMRYWFTANSQRFTVVVQMSNQYEAAYCGFIKPIAIERQYPYPLLIGASAYDGLKWSSRGGGHSAYLNPSGTETQSSCIIRRPDGTWKGAGSDLVAWPTNTNREDTFTVYNKDREEVDPEDHMLYPIMYYEQNPVGWLGELDGVYWVCNRADISAKDIITYNGTRLYVFYNVYDRDDDGYFAIEWK